MKIERDGNVSILRIRDISLRDTGEIQCIASVNGKGPSISCIAKLQLQNLLYDFNDSMMKPEDIQSQAQAKQLLTNTNLVGTPKKVKKLSSLKCRRRHEKSLTHTRSSSFPRCTTSCTKHISPLPIKKCIFNNNANNALIEIQKSQFEDELSVQRIIKKNLNSNLEFSKDQKLSSLNKEDITDTSIKSLSPKKTKQLYPQNIDSVSNKKHMELRLEELIKATIIKEPTDISVFRGSKAVLRVTYQGCPEPTVKWLRVVGFFCFYEF